MSQRALFSLLFGLAIAGCGQEGPSSPAASGATDPAPLQPVRIVDVDGVVAALAAEKGHGFLFNVWATWCPPCVAELPELVEVGRAYRSLGGSVLALSYDLMVPDVERATVADVVGAFLAQRKLELRTLIFEAPDFDEINRRLDLPGPVPVTLAIDRTGKVVDREPGQAGRARFEEMMRKALGLAASAPR